MDGSSFISLGYNFLQVTINSIDEMEKQGNKTEVWHIGETNNDDSWRNQEELTKWSDHNVAIPVLFNFYHGVELALKGLCLYCGSDKVKMTHDLSLLLKELRSTENAPDEALLDYFKRLLDFDPNGFYKKNGSNSSKYYLLLKYPESTYSSISVKYLMLRSQEEVGLQTFIEVRELAKGIRENIKAWLSRRNTK